MKREKFLEEFAAELARCSLCGLCQTACPIYRETGEENDGPRGKAALLSNAIIGNLKIEDIAWRLARCTLCGQCSRACPAHIPLQEAFQSARQYIRDYLPVPAAQKILLPILSINPEIMDILQIPAGLACKFMPTSWADKLFDAQPAIPHLPARPFSIPRPAEKKSAPSRAKRALLFTGCATRRVNPKLAQLCVYALGENHLEAIPASNLGCCGKPMLAYGKTKAALNLIRKNIAILSTLEFDWLVTVCPACLDSINHNWPGINELSRTEKAQARSIAARAIDINVLLAELRRENPASMPGKSPDKIYWHSPCLMDRKAEACAKSIIGAGGKPDFLITPDSAQCCGASLGIIRKRHTGKTIFNASDRLAMREKQNLQRSSPAQLGYSLAQALRDQIAASGAKLIATACPGCLIQLQKILARNNDHITVRHSIEIYMERFN